jgi:hypothetical protein
VFHVLRAHSAIAPVVLLGITGCAASDLPEPVFGGDGFFDHPWPSDTRMIDGALDLEGFPRRDEFSLLEGFVQLSETLDGYGNNAPVYLRFDGALDTDQLPSPAASLRDDSPILLIDVDPHSPYRGEQVPITWHFQEPETSYQPSNLLAIQPVWGFPLRPRTTYAAVVTTQVARPSPEFSEVWDEEHPEYEVYLPLQQTLVQVRLSVLDVAAATVFTTQDPTSDVTRIAELIRDEVTVPPLDQTLEPYNETQWFSAHDGQLWVPMWQHGSKPYTLEGGGLEFDDAGRARLADWERTAFTLSVPVDTEMPENGWPVVIYSHGTGGDNHGFAKGSNGLETAAMLGKAGMAGFGISQPLHGDRGTGLDPELASFNWFNPESGRTCFRQGALDQVYLARLLSSQTHSFTLEDGTVHSTDPERVAYLGHSHGGLVGAMAGPYMAENIRAAMLSGAGGGVSLSVMYRKEGDWNLEELIDEEFDLDGNEYLHELHPLVALVQMLSEVTDPLNYSPYWSQWEPSWDSRSLSVLMTEGLEDVHTPPVATEALAGAGRLPILDPVARASDAATLQGGVGQATPVSGNIEGWDGESVSGGLAQYEGEDHFVIFDRSSAARLWQEFLLSALEDDVPEISDP